jgi:hypothetical protein
MLTNEKLPEVREEHSLRLSLQPHQGLSLLLSPPGLSAARTFSMH